MFLSYFIEVLFLGIHGNVQVKTEYIYSDECNCNCNGNLITYNAMDKC